MEENNKRRFKKIYENASLTFTSDHKSKFYKSWALNWCRRHSKCHIIVFIVFLFPVVMKFYCDVYCIFYTKLEPKVATCYIKVKHRLLDQQISRQNVPKFFSISHNLKSC